MKRQKLASDINPQEMKLIDEARKGQYRTRANFIKVACLEKAKKILNENGKKSK